MPLDDKDLQRFIAEQGIEAELVYPSEATPTVAAAAAALGVPTKSIVKSLVFVAGTGPHLIIAAGEALIDPKRLRDVLGVSRRNLRMAAPEEALEISGYEVGAMPPFGHLRVLPTLIDSVTVTEPLLYGGGGSKTAMIRLSRATLLAATKGRLAPLTGA
ncbi:MAG: hypothetical protein M3511_03615 [Deinococcota bacterium]|jgi:prolyl-tRNA editing enzyme YbaK/EbsC (Cys-tRNA(Pro) deacylase)|nr:hypothetical protein [Deinococcota bacterium]